MALDINKLINRDVTETEEYHQLMTTLRSQLLNVEDKATREWLTLLVLSLYKRALRAEHIIERMVIQAFDQGNQGE